MSKPLKKILDSVDKRLRDSQNPLTFLFRSILISKGIDLHIFEQLMNKFLKLFRLRYGTDDKQTSSVRSNLVKEFCRDQMTFKVLLKCLMFLDPKMIRIYISLKWRDNTVTTSHWEVDVDSVQFQEFVDSDSEEFPTVDKSDGPTLKEQQELDDEKMLEYLHYHGVFHLHQLIERLGNTPVLLTPEAREHGRDRVSFDADDEGGPEE